MYTEASTELAKLGELDDSQYLSSKSHGKWGTGRESQPAKPLLVGCLCGLPTLMQTPFTIAVLRQLCTCLALLLFLAQCLLLTS